MNPNLPRALAWLLALFFLESSFFSITASSTPALLLLAVIFFGLYEGLSFGLLTGIFAGLLMDLFGVGKFGYSIFFCTALGSFSGYLSEMLSRESLVTQILLVVLSSLLWIVSGFVLQGIFYESEWAWKSLRQEILRPQLLVVFFFSPFLFWLMRKSWQLRAKGSRSGGRY